MNEKIYREFYSKVYGYILSKVNNVQTAEDLAANVFVKIFEKIGTFDESKASLSTWIYTITRNTLTDYYRTGKVFCEMPETQTDGYCVEDEVCNAEMLEVLAKALENLDKREREIIVLRFYFGKSLKTISEKMGISYTYVKILQKKAFKKIKQYLE